jgi:hypothetical protein
MGWACSTNGEKMNACGISAGEPEEKRPLGRPRCRWVDNIKMDLREIGWGGMDWIDLAQHRKQWRALVNTVMNLRVALKVEKVLSTCTTGSFSRRVQLHEVSFLKLSWSLNACQTFGERERERERGGGGGGLNI